MRWEEGLGVLQVMKLRHIKYDCHLYKVEAKKRTKKTMIATWSENEDESSKEENEKEVANMCSMAIDELDEVNSNISYDDLHDAFEDLYEDLEKLGLKNAYLKKKIQQLEKNLEK